MTGVSSVGEPLVITALTVGGNAAITPFIGLHTADPGATGTGASEVSTTSTGYARTAPGTFTNAGNNPTVGSNSAVITFPPAATNPWGTITHFSINTTAATAGTMIGSGALTTAKAVNVGDTARFAIGALTITVN
jgi:hypothetical protein